MRHLKIEDQGGAADGKGPRSSAWKEELARVARSRAFLYAAAGLIALFVVKTVTGYFLHRGVKEALAVVEVVHPTDRSIDNSISLPGNFEAIEQASIYAHVAGYLKKIYVDEGDRVKKGQLMAVIDAPDVQQEYQRAKADYDLEAVTLSRNKGSVGEKVISEQEFDTVSANAQKAKARLDNAVAEVGYTEIRAPFAGAVARRFKYPGDLIELGGRNGETPLFVVINEDELRIVLSVPQIDVTRVKVGFPVDISVDALAGTVLHGQVSRLDDLLDSSTKTQRVLIDIPNDDRKLHAGMFATVTLHLDHRDHVSAIPEDAVTTEPVTGKSWVWTVRGGKIQKAEVTLGIEDGNWSEVTAGLSPADWVVPSARGNLVEGAAVDTREAK